jgi:hypothetical protein
MSLQGFRTVLKWADFPKRDCAPITGRAAYTDPAYSTNIGLMRNGDKVVIDPDKLQVNISLDTTTSWVVKGEESDSLLAHEQGHYGITALGARDYHANLLKLEANYGPGMKSKVDALNSSVQALIGQINQMYDEDVNCGTNHGKLADKQAQWELRINNLKNNAQGRLNSLATCPQP